MADEMPVTPSVPKPSRGPHPRRAAGRAANAGPVRPGVTPVNSPAAIPAIMRGPVAPLPPARQAAVATTDKVRPRPGRNDAEPGNSRPEPGRTRSGERAHSTQDTAAVRTLPTPGLWFRPIVQVADVAAAIVFYEHLGAEIIHGGPETDYVLLQLGTVQIGLIALPGNAEMGAGRIGSANNHGNADRSAVQLNFAAAQPLDELERHLRGRRVTIARSVHDTAFGPQLHVRAPDGLLIRIGRWESEDSL